MPSTLDYRDMISLRLGDVTNRVRGGIVIGWVM